MRADFERLQREYRYMETMRKVRLLWALHCWLGRWAGCQARCGRRCLVACYTTQGTCRVYAWYVLYADLLGRL